MIDFLLSINYNLSVFNCKIFGGVFVSNVEINARSKKVALLGVVIILVIAVALGAVSVTVARKGNLEASANVGVAALKAQLMDLTPQASATTLTVNKVYAIRADETIDLSKGDETARKAILGSDSKDKVLTSAQAKAMVYIEYTATEDGSGKAVGGSKFLAYVCKDDVVYVVDNIDSEGKTIISAKAQDSRESLIEYQNSGLASVQYLKITAPDAEATMKMPTDMSDWTELDAATLTEYIRRKA